MSRPVLPTFSVPGWTIPVWAPDTNYAAGSDPWSGLATKVAHPGAGSVGIVPRTAVAAQVLNKLVHDAYATDEDAKDHATTLTGELQTFAGNVLAFAGQAQAFNWHTKSSEIVDSSRIAWDSSKQRLVSVGGTDVIKESYDGGKTWSSTISTGVTSAGTLREVMADTSGKLAIIGSSGKTLDFDGTSFTYHASGIGFTPVAPRGLWAPSDSLFCVIDRDGGGTPYIYTSPTGATWTSRTVPSNFAPTTSDIYAIAYGNGRIVIACRTASSTVKTAYSDDGGATWSNGASLTIAFDPGEAQCINLAYSDSIGKWVLTCAKTDIGAATSTEVYTSTLGGATWTLATTLTSANFRSLSCIGGLFVALWDKAGAFTLTGDNGLLAYSLDGTSWKHAGRLGLGETPKQVIATPNRFVALVTSSTGPNAYCYASHAMGEGPALT